MILTRHLAANAVDSSKLANKSVTAEKLNDSAVTSEKIDWENVRDKLYPVGAVYTSTTATNPSTIMGGTWLQLSYVEIAAYVNNGYAMNMSGGASQLGPGKQVDLIMYTYENNNNTRYQLRCNGVTIYFWRRTA